MNWWKGIQASVLPVQCPLFHPIFPVVYDSGSSHIMPVSRTIQSSPRCTVMAPPYTGRHISWRLVLCRPVSLLGRQWRGSALSGGQTGRHSALCPPLGDAAKLPHVHPHLWLGLCWVGNCSFSHLLSLMGFSVTQRIKDQPTVHKGVQ